MGPVSFINYKEDETWANLEFGRDLLLRTQNWRSARSLLAFDAWMWHDMFLCCVCMGHYLATGGYMLQYIQYICVRVCVRMRVCELIKLSQFSDYATAGWPRVSSWYPAWMGVLSSLQCPKRLWGPPSLLSIEYWGPSLREYSDRDMKFTTYLYLVPRLNMREAVPLLVMYIRSVCDDGILVQILSFWTIERQIKLKKKVKLSL
jgi:hypothetical protein